MAAEKGVGHGLDHQRMAKVATALNGNFLPAASRAATALKAGDALEVVAPMQGG